MQCCLEPQGQNYIEFSLCTVVPGVLTQCCTGFFLCNSQCCLDPLGQICSHKVFICEMLSQEYQGNINSIFSCALLSGASRTTLHEVFTCSMLSHKSIKTALNRIFFLRSVVVCSRTRYIAQWV